MLSITIHIPAVSLSTLNTPENGDNTVIYIDKNGDDNHIINGNGGPILTIDRDISMASLSTARCGFGIISTNDAIYAVGMFLLIRIFSIEIIFFLGGYDRGDCLDTIERFNPIEDRWTLLSFPMISRRGRVAAAILNNKIYVCGGSDGQKELNTGEYFDLQTMDKWLPIKDLDRPVAHGGKILFNITYIILF